VLPLDSHHRTYLWISLQLLYLLILACGQYGVLKACTCLSYTVIGIESKA
jgi:hypothetical protein